MSTGSYNSVRALDRPESKPKPGPSQRDKHAADLVDRLAGRRIGLMRAVEESYHASNSSAPSLPPAALAEWGLAGGVLGADTPLQTPGDFPNILSGLANKLLEDAPPVAPVTYPFWAFQLPPVPDFKPHTIVKVAEFGELPYHHDGDGFEQSSLIEGHNWIQVGSYGDEFGLTPKMMVDDDLDAFAAGLRSKQAAHDMTLNRLCVNLLTGNAVLSDGYELFDAAQHGNDMAAGGVPSTAQLSAMRLLLRQQTGLSGRVLGLELKCLLVPSELETTTQQVLQRDLAQYPQAESGTNPFRGQVDHFVEPILSEDSALKYYGFGLRSNGSICFAHQTGFERMRTRSYYNPRNNCRIWQCEGRFAVAGNNYWGVVRNPGA